MPRHPQSAAPGVPNLVRPRIGVSSCLLGNAVRYDGNHKLDRHITATFGRFLDLVPVCPEVECGLGVPREPMRLVGDRDHVRLLTLHTGLDHTAVMLRWARVRLEAMASENLSGFIFKSRSPSSALCDAKVHDEAGRVVALRPGLFAAAFTAAYPLVPVIDEDRLHDPALRENFIERVFTLGRWRALGAGRVSGAALAEFHARHKLLIMAHGPRHLYELGRMAASAGRAPSRSAIDEYGSLLMACCALEATRRKHTNVLQHMAGYFKRNLSAVQKAELQEAIARYHDGLAPLVVPLTLLRHYVRLFDEPYLRTQVYLDPHPCELMLRNHA